MPALTPSRQPPEDNASPNRIVRNPTDLRWRIAILLFRGVFTVRFFHLHQARRTRVLNVRSGKPRLQFADLSFELLDFHRGLVRFLRRFPKGIADFEKEQVLIVTTAAVDVPAAVGQPGGPAVVPTQFHRLPRVVADFAGVVPAITE